MDHEEQLSGDVIGAAIEVHRIMGPGLLESVYQACVEHELNRDFFIAPNFALLSQELERHVRRLGFNVES